MFETIEYPQELAPEELDLYLSQGWFRMGQSIFTTDYVMFEHLIYRTFWLRHVLKNFDGGKSFEKLKKRNRDFRVELKQIEISRAHEALFKIYKAAMHFDTASSLMQLMYGYVYVPANVFDTYEINIYDGARLIGCTYFDIGKQSAEGISAFYDPAYTAHSLGRYLIYLQIEVCRKNGFMYYYPGYFVQGYPHLDYKLAIGKDCLEYFDKAEMNWYPIGDYVDTGISLDWESELLADDEENDIDEA